MAYIDDMFTGAPKEWRLPITEKGKLSLTYWRQQEYVTCMQAGFGFAGHSKGAHSIWHYKLPTPDGWVYITVDPLEPLVQSYDDPRNPFKPTK